MRYMLLIYETGERPAPGTPEAEAVVQGHRAFEAECRRRGAFLAADPLYPPTEATTVVTDGGEMLVSDGPFAETREWLAGYYMVECADREEAHELAARVPACAHGGKIEVRPVVERGPDPKSGR
jgi:hypothetical protein